MAASSSSSSAKRIVLFLRQMILQSRQSQDQLSSAKGIIFFLHQMIQQSRQSQDQPSSSSTSTTSTSTATTISTDPGLFDCNICFSQAKDPVVTCCGHLYCWPCLYTWVRCTSCCAVCRGLLLPDHVFPIYGANGGGDGEHHNGARIARKSGIPRRPPGLRINPPDEARKH